VIGYLFTATLIVAYLAAFIGSLIIAIDREDWRWLVVFALLFIFLIAFIIKGATEDEAKGPCVRYETQYSYNAATKTNMPYRVCAERGEWIK
jgi:MFS family permease